MRVLYLNPFSQEVSGPDESLRAMLGVLVPTGVEAHVVLPAGAHTFKPEWAALIPRGATVALCHDADEDGDQGAAKAAKIIGGCELGSRARHHGGRRREVDPQPTGVAPGAGQGLDHTPGLIVGRKSAEMNPKRMAHGAVGLRR